MKGALVEQVGYQKETFNSLPAEGDKLENGRDVILDPPEKGWVENGGWDETWYLGWASDYEARQADFVSTNDRANAAMERYQGQTEGVIARMPEFKPVEQPPPPPVQAPGTGMQSADSHMAGASTSSPASTASAWASSSPSVGAVPPAPTPSPTSGPAASAPAWATPGLPPGVVRGPAARLPAGAERLGAAEPLQRPVGSLPARRPRRCRGARGVGGRGGQQQEGEEEHERPSWLTETEDVFTNDLDRVAPPVFGEWRSGGRG